METKPEEYLREIRDLEVQNKVLLTELVEYFRHEAKQRKWKMLGRILMIFIPYLLTALLFFLLYSKMVHLLADAKDSISPPSLSEVQESSENILEKLKQFVE